jgi:hypothetical protein
MMITARQDLQVHKIFVHRDDDQQTPDRPALLAALTDLARRGRITDRDEELLEYMRELNVLSLNQAHRLLFTAAKQKKAYNRLWFLTRQYLLADARTPFTDMRAWGLPPGKVYTLGAGGRLWLKEEVDAQPARHLNRHQVLHDLLTAELYVRLAEAARRRGPEWRLTWAGESQAGFFEAQQSQSAAAVPVVSPDGLAIIRQQRTSGGAAYLPLFIELDAGREAHGRPSSDWGRKITGYDRFFSAERQKGRREWMFHPMLQDLPPFPYVTVITHGEQRLLNLAGAISQHRREAVVYYLALWTDLLAGEDILTAPVWAVVTPDGQIVGEAREQRQPLLAAPAKKAKKQEN